MTNIDPVYFLTPLTVLAFSFGLLLYWRLRRSLTLWAILASLIAYAGAIALKEILQAATLTSYDSAVGGNLALLGVYYGSQTALFEVGGAFLVAFLAVKYRKLGERDAEGFGLSLAFWENAVLLALPLLLDYLVFYFVLAHPGTAAYQALYPTLSKNSPALFYGPAAALRVVGLAVLERVSSLLAHFSWGLLAVFAATRRKYNFLLVAAPLGFVVDFLTPFSGVLGLVVFEVLLFLVCLVGLWVTLHWTRGIRRELRTREPPVPPADAVPPTRPAREGAWPRFGLGGADAEPGVPEGREGPTPGNGPRN